jgi:hypothetical protein
MTNDRASFDDVMLDWAAAELLSPTWPTNWAGPARDRLKRKLQNAGTGSLGIDERSWLVEAIIRCRSPIISVYGPSRSWSFRRTVVSSRELSAFSIIHHYGYPDFSFGNLAAKIKDNPSGEEQKTRDIVTAILAQAAGGKKPFGLPIAVAREARRAAAHRGVQALDGRVVERAGVSRNLPVHSLRQRILPIEWAGAPRLGICWRSSSTENPERLARNLPVPMAEKLRAAGGFVSLQREDLGAFDFLDTARVIAGLDLVVTIDTAVAHLAGALGVPTWVMLAVDCDWRWMQKRFDSPWYPALRLFRQPAPGDWRSVIADVCASLRERGLRDAA